MSVAVVDTWTAFIALAEDPRLDAREGLPRALLAVILGQRWGVEWPEVIEASQTASSHWLRDQLVAVGRVPQRWKEERKERTSDLEATGLGLRLSENLVALTAHGMAVAEHVASEMERLSN